MPLNNITFNKQGGGLGRPLPGKDHYSGLLFYGTQSGYTQSGSYETLFSIDDLDAAPGDDLFEYVNDFFNQNDKGVLFLGVFATSSSNYDFDETIELQNYAGGEIRQMLVVSDQTLTSNAVSALQLKANALENSYRPTQMLLSGDFGTYSDLTTLPDLRAAGRKNISVVVSKDANKNIDASGSLLGAISRAKVSENIGWVAKFNIQAGDDYDDVELLTGENLSDLSDTQLESIKNKGYITLRSFTDFSGIYFTDSDTCDVSTSDFAFIENNRTIDKSVRNVRVTLLPDLNSPLVLEPTGFLSEATIKYFQSKCENTLQDLVNRGELSAYRVVINPEQNVLSTSELVINLSLVPIGVARFIKVNIGFALNI
jgi:hypothetical protein